MNPSLYMPGVPTKPTLHQTASVCRGCEGQECDIVLFVGDSAQSGIRDEVHAGNAESASGRWNAVQLTSSHDTLAEQNRKEFF